MRVSPIEGLKPQNDKGRKSDISGLNASKPD